MNEHRPIKDEYTNSRLQKQYDGSEKPKHYQASIDPIEFLEANTHELELQGFLRGNVIKYITRFDKKGGLVDLDKAMDYLNRLREHYVSTGGA